MVGAFFINLKKSSRELPVTRDMPGGWSPELTAVCLSVGAGVSSLPTRQWKHSKHCSALKDKGYKTTLIHGTAFSSLTARGLGTWNELHFEPSFASLESILEKKNTTLIK